MLKLTIGLRQNHPVEKEMTESEYKKFTEDAESGAVLIGIDRAFARKFYTDIPITRIKEETGETPYFEKLVVLSAFISAPIALLISCILSVLAFHWWAVIVIPLSILVYIKVYSHSSLPQVGMLGVSIMLVLAILSIFTGFFSSSFVQWYFIDFVFSLWAARLIYILSTVLLRAFVLRNRRALEYMEGYVYVQQTR